MASLEREKSFDSKNNAAHVEDATRVASNNGSTEKKDLGALEAQTPEDQNEVS